MNRITNISYNVFHFNCCATCKFKITHSFKFFKKSKLLCKLEFEKNSLDSSVVWNGYCNYYERLDK